MATTSFNKNFKINEKESQDFEDMLMQKPSVSKEIKSEFVNVCDLPKLKRILSK